MRNVLNSDRYKRYPLSETYKNNEGFYLEILRGIKSLFDYMINKHNQVYFTMFSLRFPSGSMDRYPNDNTIMSNFIEMLIIQCNRRKYDPKYLWVREDSSTGQYHYHFILLLDGDYIQSAHIILQMATEIWQKCLGIKNGRGLVQLCKPYSNIKNQYGNGVKIRRSSTDFQEVYGQCYQLASYLAKCYSKGNLPPYVNGFGRSRTSRLVH